MLYVYLVVQSPIYRSRSVEVNDVISLPCRAMTYIEVRSVEVNTVIC